MRVCGETALLFKCIMPNTQLIGETPILNFLIFNCALQSYASPASDIVLRPLCLLWSILSLLD